MPSYSNSTNHILHVTHSIYKVWILILLCNFAASSPPPWWHDPCHNRQVRIRHSRSIAEPHLVRRQLGILSSIVNSTILRDLNNLYQPLNRNPLSFHTQQSWLRVKKMLNRMRPIATRLQEFHKALQIFAGALHKLSRIKVQTSVTDFRGKFRRKIYQTAMNYVKLLMCEVEFTIEQQQITDSVQDSKMVVPDGIPLKKMKILVPHVLDLTNAYILDSVMFKKLKQFVQRSQKMFERRFRKRKSRNGRLKGRY